MKIIVTGEFTKDLKIQFSEGIWNVTYYTLFEDLNVVDLELPKDPSLYKMTIAYNSENFYFENVLYISNPNFDTIIFNFYKEHNRIFCKIKSEIVMELDKEIVLNPLPGSLEELKKNS
jgi:hypothetical protein